MRSNLNSTEWPALPFAEWEATCDTVHMWTQIVGKTRMVLSAPVNHWWHTALYVTPCGLNTSPIPYGDQTFDVEFDFIAHQVRIATSTGRRRTIPLYPRSVADFYTEYMAALQSFGIEFRINRAPCEFDDTTPFDQDQHHASYDREYVERFRRILVLSDGVFKQFRSRFTGKCSPVHFFWGSFDLAVTRFSGKPAPANEKADPVTREAYSHEVSSCGFWPGNRQFQQPAFYAYAAPAPAGFDKQPVSPGGWDSQLGEYILKYEEARHAAQPAQAVLDFCQSTYDAAARLANWDRTALERR
jgi:hypothetical protein